MTLFGTVNSKTINADVIQKTTIKLIGLHFPIGGSPNGGFFSRTSNLNLIRSEVKQLLLTEPGERVMLPNYGIGLHRFAFEPLDEQTYEELSHDIHAGFLNYLPNVDIVSLGIFFSDSQNYKGIPGLVVRLTVKPRDINQTIDIQIEI